MAVLVNGPAFYTLPWTLPSSVAFTLQRYASYLPGWGDNGAMDSALSDTS